MILDDPGLDGVAAVLFDEFHERSLDADLGLAFARDVQSVLRDDLRLLIMSATLDGAGSRPCWATRHRREPGADVPGRHPLSGPRRPPAAGGARRPRRRASLGRGERQRAGLPAGPGRDPPRRELAERAPAPAGRRCRPALWRAGAGRAGPRHRAAPRRPPQGGAGHLDRRDQPDHRGRAGGDRRGLARVPRYDPASGITRLETVRVSRAAADQRRGRAGRTEPGVCYRLWDEPETRALPAFARPEILEADLSRLALDLARWGARDPAGLTFLDPPPAAAFAEARTLLTRIQALGRAGRPDRPRQGPGRDAAAAAPGAHGRPRRRLRPGREGAQIAAVLTEQGLGGKDVDLRRPAGEPAPRSLAPKPRRHGPGRALEPRSRAPSGAKTLDDGLMLAEAYPERVAKARGKPGEFQLAGGRGVYLEPTDPLAREAWLAVGELGGGDSRDRILLAAAVDEADAARDLRRSAGGRGRLETAGGKVRAKRLLRLGKLVVEERLIENPDPAMIAGALMDQVRRRALRPAAGRGRRELPQPRGVPARALDAEAWPDLSDAALSPPGRMAGAAAGRPLVAGQRRRRRLDGAIRSLVPWELQRRSTPMLPARFGPDRHQRGHRLRRRGGPRIDIRVQELFGLTEHPASSAARRWCCPCCPPVTSRSRSPGPAGVLEGLVARGEGRDEGPLSAPRLARRSRGQHSADDAGQASGNVKRERSCSRPAKLRHCAHGRIAALAFGGISCVD
jgi:ATP-dependent helicase HrpB